MTIGSGILRALISSTSTVTAIAAVGKSMMARLPSTYAAPAIAPAAAAVTPATKVLTRALLDQRRKCGARKITIRYGGRKTPTADTAAPERPATRKPMKATVMTTGPGVIIA